MFDCNNVYSVWDKRLIRGIKNYRREAKQTEYKAGRDKERSAHVFSFEDKTTVLLEALGVKNMYPGILEADDVIYWLTKNIPGEKVVVSVDQDMLQLIDDQTFVYSPIKDVIIDKNNFADKIGVEIDQFLRYKSLMGDKSDNLPGIPRCGAKTAAKLVKQHQTDDDLVKALGESTLEPYFHNKIMIDLSQGHEHHPEDTKLYQKQYEYIKQIQPDMRRFKQLAEDSHMKQIVDKIDVWRQAFASEQLTKTLKDIVNGLGLSK